jgi:hypothetical protein
MPPAGRNKTGEASAKAARIIASCKSSDPHGLTDKKIIHPRITVA